MELFRKTVSGIMLTLLLTSMLTLAFNIQPIYSELQTTLYIDPAAMEASVTDDFAINVSVSAVFDLFGFEFYLGYNTTFLDVLGVVFQHPFSESPSPLIEIVDAEGYVHVAAMLPPDYPSLSGSFALASIIFKAVSIGSCILDLYNASLLDSMLNPIGHMVNDGYVKVKPIIYAFPVASFSYSHKSNVEDHEVTFDASASYDPDGNIVDYVWDFGDGNKGAGKIIKNVYAKSNYPNNEYTVTLTVTDNDGLKDKTEKKVVIGNLIAGQIIAIQAIFFVNLIKGKATTFWISVYSTFDEKVTTDVLIQAAGFNPWTYSFSQTFNPGDNAFYLHDVKPGAPKFRPQVKPSVAYTFTVDSSNSVRESYENDNVYSKVHEVTDTRPIRILFVMVHHQNEPNANRITYDQAFQYATQTIRFLVATYPLAESEVSYGLSPIPLVIPVGTNPQGVTERLRQRMDGYDRVVGVCSDGWINRYLNLNADGFAADIGRHAVSTVAEIGFPSVVAHEIGHTYELYEDYDPTLAPGAPARYWNRDKNTDVDSRSGGYDVLGGQRKPRLRTFMNTGGNLADRWVDKRDYEWLMEKLRDRADPEVLLLSGIIFKNNSATFSNIWYRLSEGIGDIEAGGLGNYYIVLLNDLNNTLSRVGFNATFGIASDPPIEIDEAYFGFRLSWVDGTRMVQLQDASGNVLATRTVSPNPPSVTVISPNGSEIYISGTNYTITWSASDPDGDILTYDVHISWDGGYTWIPLETSLKQTSFTYDFSNLPGGNKYLVRIFANDGVNVGEDTSDTFFTVSSFTIEVVTSPQIIQSGDKAKYTINVASFGNFGSPVTLNATSLDTNNFMFRWITSPSVTPPPNGSTTAILEIEAANVLEGGNHTIMISGISDSNIQFAVTYIFALTHDIAITELTPSKTVVEQGYPVSVNITIENQGYFLETFNITAYYNGTPIGNQTVYLHAGSSTTSTFTWDTTGVTLGNYTISAYATPVPGEADTIDNTYINGIVTIKPPLSVSISPFSASLLVGQSVTFTSTVSGGYSPYGYQWYLGGAPVSGETSSSWTFTPTASGIYYVYLKVTDANGNVAQSETARITVATVPVGGYSIPIQLPTTAKPATIHIALLTILTAIFITIKQKTRRKPRQ